MTWAQYVAYWQDPYHVGMAVWHSFQIFVAYSVGRYVGRKENK